MSDPAPKVSVEYREDQSILITAGWRTSIVHSAHLVDERITQLLRPGWGMPINPPLTVRENDLLCHMKQSADEYGLWSEVKEHYDRCRISGDPPHIAAFHALYEWDLV
jgi:hypothetical protein